MVAVRAFSIDTLLDNLVVGMVLHGTGHALVSGEERVRGLEPLSQQIHGNDDIRIRNIELDENRPIITRIGLFEIQLSDLQFVYYIEYRALVTKTLAENIGEEPFLRYQIPVRMMAVCPDDDADVILVNPVGIQRENRK